ncbi:adenine DNA glycosylase [Plakobranchus ocellatus]|uniref:Adenine DNA glycosylase n=1 Tax=Plakobranchus ocellatus TaxID=259542 RepID=A0AAV3ZRY4_9GAST|nr:adenine DNA glycosylase [Plakobranchus ocellatus]
MVRRKSSVPSTNAATIKTEDKTALGEQSEAESSSIHRFTKEEILFLRLNLLSWYDKNKRDLPWRKISCKDINQSAYATWVSEIMLQQTQVATVIDYYNKWMKKWPTLEALAASNIETENDKKTAAKRICTEVKKESNGAPEIIDIECLVPDCKFCLPSDAPWDKELGVLNFPRKPKKASVKQEELNVIVIQSAEKKALSKYLICQRPHKGLLAGLWEFPNCCQQDSQIGVAQAITASCEVEDDWLSTLKEVGEVSHMFSHIHHLYKVWSGNVAANEASQVLQFDGRPVKWVTENEMEEAAIPTGMKKVFREYKKSTTVPSSSKRKYGSDDVIIKDPKKTQASISDFFKKKNS